MKSKNYDRKISVRPTICDRNKMIEIVAGNEIPEFMVNTFTTTKFPAPTC